MPTKSILKNSDTKIGNTEESKGEKSASKSKKNDKSGKSSSKGKSTAGAEKGENEEKPSADHKYQLYESVRKLVIEEEERLPLWMLMSKEEKLDMLAHECIDSEA